MDTGPEKLSAPHRAFRIALTTVKWLGVAVCVGAMLVVLINLRDEELTPEAKALAEFQPPAVPDQKNAYLALVGFDAPIGGDPIAAGAKIVAANDADATADPTGIARASKMENVLPVEGGNGRLQFVGDMAALCDPLSKPCMQSPLIDAEKVRAMMAANAELVSRYLELQKLPEYVNTASPDPLQPMPSGGWSGARRLLLTQAALDAQSGQEERALAFLTADMALWRRVLAAGSGMIDEMIAARVLTSDVAQLSEFIATPSFDIRGHQAEMLTMLAPLTPAERNAAAMFNREYALSSKLAAAYHADGTGSEEVGWWNRLQIKLLFKKNASLNDSAIMFTRLKDMASRPPVEFVAQREVLQREATAMSEPGISWFYNPIGKTLVRIAYPSYPEFVARVFDVVAYVQLVRAQLQVRLADLASDRVPQFLEGTGPESRNPYDNQPFAWSPATRRLSFEPMNTRVWDGWKFQAVVPPPTSVAAR
jgi:hypothetical protein